MPLKPVLATVAGLALTACIALSAVASLTGVVPLLAAGLPAWLAGVILWRDVPRRVRIQASVLLAVGGLGLAAGFFADGQVDWHTAVAGNALLIAMLGAVSFLRLIAVPPTAASAEAPPGRRSLVNTLAGVHLFGSVVNLPTVFIMARRMSDGHTLTRQQAITLVRGFGSAAFWSPFFAAMAAALTYAPGARLPLLLAFGGPLALAALALTFRDVSALDVDAFHGYPINFGSLWLPGLLGVAILLAHSWRPSLSVLGLIALLAPSVTAVTLLLTDSRPGQTLGDHVRRGLPAMRGELVLFLSAGVMAAGLMSLVSVTGVALPFEQFGGLQAGLLLTVLVALSIVGVHPVIGVAAAAAVVAPLDPNPSLLASCFLAAWGIGVAVSPLSAMNLALQGAYSLRPLDLLRWNLPYAAVMIAIASALFFLHPGA
ncbi:hypothetical protein SPICUR_09465 [Spiribacter curvatus]|uniref:Citrate transporter-like domain-containing protein n=1 Tax=Spiribacter curvatus TaxID=1335757 RepID=U5T961_9GAMM|nr:hypothetical protein [Spiribacter curvatus]AGY92812.1 hypothetical protein SPICUR_09465 [Spiribacter curvatus]